MVGISSVALGGAMLQSIPPIRIQIGPPRETYLDFDSAWARRLRFSAGAHFRSTSFNTDTPQPERVPTHTLDVNGVLLLSRRLGEGWLSANFSARRREAPNRAGLDDGFALVGQGYGFAGLQPRTSGLPSQNAAGQDIVERTFSQELSYAWAPRPPRSDWEGRFTLQHEAVGLRSLHTGPALGNFTLGDPRFDPNGDGPFEYLPTVDREATRLNASLKRLVNGKRFIETATLKLGHAAMRELYALAPGSQLALDALASMDRRLVGDGQFLFDDFFQSVPTLDTLGNQVFALNPGASVPTVAARRELTTIQAEEGLWWSRRISRERSPSHESLVIAPSLGYRMVRDEDQLGGGFEPGVKIQLSGAWGAMWVGAKRDFTYDETYAGSYFGASLPIERTDAFEAVFQTRYEWPLKLQISAFHRDIQNRRLVGTLVPGAQIGLWGTYALDRVRTTGIKTSMSYERPGWRLGGVWTNAISRAKGLDNTGFPIDGADPMDEGNSLLLFGTIERPNWGVTLHWSHGSGLPSSDLFGTGDRRRHERWDFSVAHRLGSGRLALRIENVFDSHDLLSFNSRYLGTTFQRGRRFIFQYELFY